MDERQQRLLHGGCYTFARVLRKRLGRTAKLVDLVEPDVYTFRYGAVDVPHHVLIEYQGFLYDASGKHTAQEVLKQWAKAPDINKPKTLRLEKHDVKRARSLGYRVQRHLIQDANLLAASLFA
jgi:hypothetical protein